MYTAYTYIFDEIQYAGDKPSSILTLQQMGERFVDVMTSLLQISVISTISTPFLANVIQQNYKIYFI